MLVSHLSKEHLGGFARILEDDYGWASPQGDLQPPLKVGRKSAD
jgi:hypothetical protein